LWGTQKGNPQPLTDALLGLELNALKDVFIDEKNWILDLLAEKETSEHLAWMLSKLDPDNLNAVLRAGSDKFLNMLIEKGFSKHLAWVLFRLKPTDLNAILQINTLNSVHLAAALICLKPDALNDMLTNNENGVLACLLKEVKAKNGSLDDLVRVFSCVNSRDRKDLLTDNENGVLALLVSKAKEGHAEYLAVVLAGTIDEAYIGFKPDDLNDMLTYPETEILACLVAAAQEGHSEYLALVLVELDSKNLNVMLAKSINSKDGNNTILKLLVEKAIPEHLA
jgi:hypothetical protein